MGLLANFRPDTLWTTKEMFYQAIRDAIINSGTNVTTNVSYLINTDKLHIYQYPLPESTVFLLIKILMKKRQTIFAIRIVSLTHKL